MGKRSQKHAKRNIHLYIMLFILIILLIGIMGYIVMLYNEDLYNKYLYKVEEKISEGIEIISSKNKEDEEITEEKARQIAVKQFEKLGEKISKKDLNVTRIKRDDEKYYYITSRENTLEIKILGGQITRINSVVIE